MIAGFDVSNPVRVLVRDAASGRWLQFSHPREIVTAFTLADVASELERVEQAVTQGGLYAAGFVSYEAAPAFDPALTVKGSSGFPLLWFGLYEGVEEIELPAPVSGLDLVVSSMVLHHLPDVAAAFRRLRACLSVGGWIAVADLDAEDGSFHSDRTGVFHNGFDRQTVLEWLAQAREAVCRLGRSPGRTGPGRRR